MVVKITEVNSELKDTGWFRRASTRILLLDIFLTIVFSLIMVFLGANLVFLFAGLLIALASVAFFWKTDMQRYDALVKQPVFEYSNRMKIFSLVFPLVFYFLPSFFSGIVGQKLADQAMFSFGEGLLLVMWVNYFQIIHWEKKNHKVVYFDKSYGIWKKSYIIRERE